jgi:hypothetical protein
MVRAAAHVLMLTFLGVLLGLVLVSFVAIGGTPAAAQQEDKEVVFKRFKELLARGDYEAALVDGQTMERVVRERYGVNHGNYAAVLNNLAVVYWELGKYAEAEEYYRVIWR